MSRRGESTTSGLHMTQTEPERSESTDLPDRGEAVGVSERLRKQVLSAVKLLTRELLAITAHVISEGREEAL